MVLTFVPCAASNSQARRQVPEVVLQKIKSLNHLDLELYKYAQEIFAKQNTNKFVSMVSFSLPKAS